MRYQPLLLALMLCFSTPTFAAKEQPKNKPAAAKAEKNKNAKSTDKTGNSKTVKRKHSDDGIEKKHQTAAEPSKKNSKKAQNSEQNNRRTDERHTKDDDKKAASKSSRKHQKADDDKRGKRAQSDTIKTKPAGKNEHKPSEKNGRRQNQKDNNRNKDNAKPSPAIDDSMRSAISAATNELEDKKALRNRTANFLLHVSGGLKELQQTRNSLSQANRRQRDAWDKFQKLSSDLNRLKTETANTRAQISRFVSGSYKNRQPNAVALFLKHAEPGQKTRFLRYTRYINSANENVIKELSSQQKQLAAQENKINAELNRLKKIQAGLQASLKKQGARNTAEQAESRRQNAQMAKEAKRALDRKGSEQRLNNLLSDLDKRKAQQRREEAEARRKAAEARLAAAEKRRQAKAAEQKALAERQAMSNLTDEDLKLRAPDAAIPASLAANSFSRMQGRLNKPANGTLAGLFGQPRGDSGDVWKGVFYHTPPANVSSLAAGNVVYADELEGYGKVVVIDHGGRYVSVYSGLSDISVANGYNVGAGHKIGTSGKLPEGEEGLYLEIRYNGQNMNPLAWII